MRRFWCLAVLYSLTANQIAWAGEKAPRPSRTAPPASEAWTKSYNQIIRSERRSQNSRTDIEKIVGGSLAFLLGTYGYYNDKQQKVAGKLIYSATQSGGIIALSSGIVGLSSVSTLAALDDEFLREGDLSYGHYQRVVVSTIKSQELGEIQKTAISTGLLAALYGYNGYAERKGNLALRNTFLFLTFNFTLFSSVSFYRWYNFEDIPSSSDSGKLRVSLDSINSLRFSITF